MSKKDKLSTPDVGVTDELDFPDMDFDSAMPKDDRSPVKKVATGFIQGAGSALVDTGFFRKLLKTVLPSGYGMALDFQEDVSKNAKQLYNNAAKEIKPSVAEMARAADKLAPAGAKGLKSKLDKISKWGSEEQHSYSDNDRADQREAGIAAALTDTFKFQMEESARSDAKEDSRNRLQEGLELNRHRDTFGMLNSINQSVSRLSQYQDKVTSVFQRKSLEVQYRSYFTSMDSLEESKQQNAIVREALANITKNTALPEYVKLQTGERLGEFARNKFMTNVSDGLFGGRSNIVSKVAKHAGEVLSNKLSGVVNAFTTAAQTMEDIADARQQMEDAGVSKLGIAGEVAGSNVAQYYASKLGKKFGAKVRENEGAMLLNEKLKGKLTNLPQTLNEYKTGNQFENDERDYAEDDPDASLADRAKAIGGKLLRWLGREGKDFIPGQQADGSLEKDSAEDLTKTTLYTKQTHKSINEIIPGYLARIFREIQIFRTGNTNIDLISYDFNKNKFLDSKSVRKNALESIVGQKDENGKTDTQNQLSEIIKVIDPKNKLSPEQQEILANKLLKENRDTKLGTAANLTQGKIYANDPASLPHATTFSKHMAEFFDSDALGNIPNTLEAHQKQNDFTEKFNRLGTSTKDSRAEIQNMINLGMYDALEELGLVQKDASEINFDKLFDYQTGKENNFKESVNAPNAITQTTKNKRVKNSGAHNKGPEHTKRTVNLATQPQPQPTINNAPSNGLDIIKSIEEFSSKHEVTQSLSTLDRIEKVLVDSKTAHETHTANIILALSNIGTGPGGETTPPNTNIFQGASINLKNLLSKGFKLGGKGLALGHSIGAKGIDALKDVSGLAVKGLSFGKEMGGKLLDKIGQVKELYLPGSLEPKLTAAKLKAGHYWNVVTNTKITSFDEIVGPIKDITTGEIVLTLEELKNSFIKTAKGSGIFKIGETLFRKAKGMTDAVLGIIPPAFRRASNMVKGIFNLAKNALDQPVDIYIPAFSLPVMLARTMRAGQYWVKSTKAVITRPSHITGAVVNADGEVVLSDEELKGGIFDKDGNPIRSPLGKLANFAKKVLATGLATGKKIFEFGKNALKGGLSKAKGLLGKLPSGEGINSGKSIDILTKIYNLLDERLKGKKVFGDKDGDGTRDGSWRSIKPKNKRDAAALAAKEKAAIAPKTEGKGILGTLKDKYDKYRDAKDAARDAADYLPDRDGQRDDRRDSRRNRKGRRNRIPPRPPAPSRLASAAKLGGKVLGGAGLAYGAYSAVDNISKGNYGSAAVDAGIGLGGYALMGGSLSGLASGIGSAAVAAGGATMTGLGMLGTGAAAVAGGIGTALASPVVLGALAVAAVGIGGYYAYKYFTAKSSALVKFRAAQYGFRATDTDGAAKAIKLEELVKPLTYYVDGKAKLSDKKFKIEEALKIFNVDIKDEEAYNNWIAWFTGRFKPVYLTHMTALLTVDKKLPLEEVDKLEPTLKLKYLELAHFQEGPYGVNVKPDKTSTFELTNGDEVEGYYTLAKKEVDLEIKDKKSGKSATGEIGAATVAGSAAIAAGGTDSNSSTKESILDPENKDLSKADNLIAANGIKTATGVAIVGALAAPRKAGNIDTLEGIRLRMYGITIMESNKVDAIRQLEDYTTSVVKYDGQGKATFDTNIETVIEQAGKAFGVVVGSVRVDDWKSWFQKRFLPVFLTYLGMTRKLSGSELKPGKVLSLTPAQTLEIANQITSISGIWSLKESPWALYKLGTDESVLKELMQGLNDAAKQAVIAEKALPTINKTEAQATKPGTIDTPKDKTVKEAVDAKGAPVTSNLDAEDTSLSKGTDSGKTPDASIGGSTGDLKLAGGPISDGRNASQFMKLGPGVSLAGVNPAIMKNLNGMIDEYGQLTKETVYLTSGKRSKEQQAALHAKDPKKAAAPGKSLHEFGLAVDASSSSLDDLDKLGLMRKYGFTRPVGGEPWHMEPAGIQSDISGFKTDPNAATSAIEASLGKGGGGLGTVKGAEKYTRDPQLAKKLFDTKSSPENTQMAKAPEVPKTDTLAGNVPEKTPESLGIGKGGSNMVSFGPNAPGSDQGIKKNVNFKTVSSEQIAANTSVTSPDAEQPRSNGKIDNVKNTEASTSGKYSLLPESNGAKGWDANKDIILGAAKMTGVDPKLMASVAAVESSFDPKAKAKTSSASGLYQFTNETWQEMMGRHGSRYGLNPNTSPFDARANALMGAEYIKQNAKALSGSKANINGTDLYLAHFLGAGGAKQFLKADPNSSAAKVLPKAAASNQSIFYEGNNERSISNVYSLLDAKVKKSLNAHGVDSQFIGSSEGLKAPDASKPSTGLNPKADSSPSLKVSNQVQPATDSNPAKPAKNRPSFSEAISSKADSAGFNLQTPPDAMQSPRSDMNAAMGDVSTTLKQSLSVQTQMLEVLQNLLKKDNSNSAQSNEPKITPVVSPAVDNSRVKQAPSQREVPVRMIRV